MKHYILYTTSKSAWIKEQAEIFAAEISKTKGRGEVKIEVVHKIPKKIATRIDPKGQIKPVWGFFPKDSYNGVIFHFTPYYRQKWRLAEAVNGTRNEDNLEYPEFFVCADTHVMAEGYEDLPEFLRLLFHEHAHFDEDLDDQLGNVLTQNSVHDMDYKLKQIHKYHYLVDYRGQALKEAVNKVMNDVIKLAKKFI
jgi:hypothetical protein